jgi:hypothetical protein
MKHISQAKLAERLGVTEAQITGIHSQLEAGVDFTEKKSGVDYSPAGADKVQTLLQVAPPPPVEPTPEKKTAQPSGPRTWKVTVVGKLPPGLVTAKLDGNMVTVRVHPDKCRRLAKDDVLEVIHYHAAQYLLHRLPARLGGGAA